MDQFVNPIPEKPVTTVEPPTGPYAEEPALEIGNLFAMQKVLQPVIAAAVGVVALIIGAAVDAALVEQLSLLAAAASLAWSAWSAQRASRKQAAAQAKATREVVYSPRTVQKIANESAVTGVAVVAPPPGDKNRVK